MRAARVRRAWLSELGDEWECAECRVPTRCRGRTGNVYYWGSPTLKARVTQHSLSPANAGATRVVRERPGIGTSARERHHAQERGRRRHARKREGPVRPLLPARHGARGEHRPRQLSGGERQRVAIARALANRPKLLLADEPTGNLDTKTGHAITDMLVELNSEKGITMVVVTHNLEVAALAKQQLRMLDGRFEEVET